MSSFHLHTPTIDPPERRRNVDRPSRDRDAHRGRAESGVCTIPPRRRPAARAQCVPSRATAFQRNLPNKRHIGKQDPYCLVTLDGEKRRTKAIKRGGQHPEWDEEIRFTVFEDDSVEYTGTPGPNGTPPPPPKKDNGPPKIKGGRFMGVACYAEDLREPDLIGETRVDLTEVLTKGETDGEQAYAHLYLALTVYFCDT